ncbi:MAG: hypothetical protein ACLTT4_12625 [Coprobacillus cateniformis]
MNVLEKILEEISEVEKEYVTGHKVLYALGATGMATEISGIIRSHMNEVPNCGECNRRKWYQMGYEDGKKNDGWVPYTSQNIPKKENVYLVTCDDEEYPVKRMRFKEDLWYWTYGIYDGRILAYQSLPEPYKEG